MTDVETSLDVTLLEDLDFEPACAHFNHDADKSSHDDGQAKFVFHFKAKCGSQGHQPVCARYAEAARGTRSWWCRVCDAEHFADEVEFWIEPLGGK